MAAAAPQPAAPGMTWAAMAAKNTNPPAATAPKPAVIPGGAIQAHEGVGHTVAKHVGRTQAQLTQRLTDEPHLQRASTFKNTAEAEKNISAVLSAKKAEIDAWLANPQGLPRLTVEGPATEGGEVLQRGAAATRPGAQVKVILQRPPANSALRFVIITSYPD